MSRSSLVLPSSYKWHIRLTELWDWEILTPKGFGTNVTLINTVNSPRSGWKMWDNRCLFCGSLCLFLLEPSDSFAQSLDCRLAAPHLLCWSVAQRFLPTPTLVLFNWSCGNPVVARSCASSSLYWPLCDSCRLITVLFSILTDWTLLSCKKPNCLHVYVCVFFASR